MVFTALALRNKHRFTPQGNTRIFWRKTEATQLIPNEFAADLAPTYGTGVETFELTHLLTEDIQGLEPLETFGRRFNLASDFEESYRVSVDHGPIVLRFYDRIDELEFANSLRSELVGNGFLYVMTTEIGILEIDQGGQSGMAGARVDMWPVHTTGATVQHSTDEYLVKTYRLVAKVTGRPVPDRTMGDDQGSGFAWGSATWDTNDWGPT